MFADNLTLSHVEAMILVRALEENAVWYYANGYDEETLHAYRLKNLLLEKEKRTGWSYEEKELFFFALKKNANMILKNLEEKGELWFDIEEVDELMYKIEGDLGTIEEEDEGFF